MMVMMTRRRATSSSSSSSSPPLAALALLLLLLCNTAAATRLLPHRQAAESGVVVKAKAAADGGLALQEGVLNGDEPVDSTAAAEGGDGQEEAYNSCQEGNEECMQRRLLHDAHLDYIYTQHKGRP